MQQEAIRLSPSVEMDISVLRDRIKATLDPDANVRRQAELDLKYVSVTSKGRMAAS